MSHPSLSRRQTLLGVPLAGALAGCRTTPAAAAVPLTRTPKPTSTTTAGTATAAPRPGPLELVTLWGYGHSYPAGLGLTSAGYGMHQRLAGRWRCPAGANNAVAGSFMGSVVANLTGGNGQWPSGTRGLVVIDAVINSIINVTSAGDAQQQVGFVNDLRTALRILRSSAFRTSTDGSIWYGGGWASTNLTGIPNTRGTVAKSSSPGAQAVITTSARNICALVLGFASTAGVPSFTITANGTTKGTYSCGGQVTSPGPNNWNVYAVPVYGMPAGSNTVTVTRDATGQDFYLQGYLEMGNPTPPGVVLVKDVTLTAAGFAVNGADSNRTAAGLATYNGFLDSVAAEAEFADGTIAVASSHLTGFDPVAWTQGDQVHPNIIGHQVYADGIEDAAHTFAPRQGLNGTV